ncbi:MAG: DUF2196 domain-containing protein [Treponema sp.]|nr:DUF2196 domain-containing protein [Treponema sp.]
MNGQNREHIHPGCEVDIVLKKDQRSGVSISFARKNRLLMYSLSPVFPAAEERRIAAIF